MWPMAVASPHEKHRASADNAEGGKVMENKGNYRISMNLTDEQKDAILSIRQTDEYRQCSIAEIMRQLIDAGLKASGYPKED